MLKHIEGKGLEVGPGHVPLVTADADREVRYVDRWQPNENRELFPELEDAFFPRPDVVSDLNKEGLSAIASESEDFVVASHVLEHMANPLRLLTDFYRVLRPGGVLLILLPDRRLTFDRNRAATPLEHVVREYHDGVDEVDDEHILEFLTKVPENPVPPSSGPEREATFEYHRKRSIHVHCWTFDEFVEVVEYSIEQLGTAWELVDALLSRAGGPAFEEFGLVLRKSEGDLDSGTVRKQFRESLSAWMAASGLRQDLEAVEDQLASTQSQLQDARQELARRAAEAEALGTELASTRSELDIAAASLDAIRKTRTFRYTRLPRTVYGRLRELLR